MNPFKERTWMRPLLGALMLGGMMVAAQPAKAAKLDISFAARIGSFNGLSASLFVSTGSAPPPCTVDPFVVDGTDYVWVTTYYGYHRPYGAVYIRRPWGWELYRPFYPGANDVSFVIDFSSGGWAVNRRWNDGHGGWRYIPAYHRSGHPQARYIGHSFTVARHELVRTAPRPRSYSQAHAMNQHAAASQHMANMSRANHMANRAAQAHAMNAHAANMHVANARAHAQMARAHAQVARAHAQAARAHAQNARSAQNARNNSHGGNHGGGHGGGNHGGGNHGQNHGGGHGGGGKDHRHP